MDKQTPVAYINDGDLHWHDHVLTTYAATMEGKDLYIEPPIKPDANQELVEALTSIAEYWNQDDANHEAMVDACHYMTYTAQAILAKHKEQA